MNDVAVEEEEEEGGLGQEEHVHNNIIFRATAAWNVWLFVHESRLRVELSLSAVIT